MVRDPQPVKGPFRRAGAAGEAAVEVRDGDDPGAVPRLGGDAGEAGRQLLIELLQPIPVFRRVLRREP